MTFQSNSRLSKNDWITDPSIPDPSNLPTPLGWILLVRPYPIKNTSKSGLMLSSDTTDFMNYMTQIARVVKVGHACWVRPHHKDSEGNFVPWAKEGDFVSFPRHVGEKVKFKGVSYIMLNDDEITMRLDDPCVFDEESSFQLNIPEEDLKKYNTYKKEVTN